MKKQFLLSIDLEDLRTQFTGGEVYPEAVPQLTMQFLDFFDSQGILATFFTVGNIVERYPDLVKYIYDQGHEIAIHTYDHIPIDKQTKYKFEQDLTRSIQLLDKCGISEVIGFRAPFFSLTKKTQWAYDILQRHGIKYSSSVLPAKSPVYGWHDFGPSPRMLHNVLEIPITLMPHGPKVPLGGGVYFRFFPLPFLKFGFKQSPSPITSYFHPYDIDTKQPFFKHPGIPDKFIFHLLMIYNRKNLLKKLEKIIAIKDITTLSYRDFYYQTISI